MAKKTCYHSELVKLGSIQVTVESDRMQSQYQGKPDYFILQIEGETRNYNCENESCAEALTGLKGQTVIIEAQGSHEDAEILVGEPEPAPRQPARPAAPARQPQRQAAPAARPAAAAPRQSNQRQPASKPPLADPIVSAKGFVGRNRSFVQIALKAAIKTKEEFEAEHKTTMSDILFAAVFNGCCYGGSSAGVIDRLPASLDYKTITKIEKPKPQAPPPPARQPEPEPEPEPDLPPPDDDVPF